MNTPLDPTLPRCFGHVPKQADYARYHDEEWGRAVVGDDKRLFELISLEGAQAGLSWLTILRKREGYRRAFLGFEIDAVARMSDAALEQRMADPGIVRHRQKIFSVRKNAQAIQRIQAEHGSFSDFLWAHIEQPVLPGSWADHASVPTRSELSDQLAARLKGYGMAFVGSTTVYAFMQAIGMVNDHLRSCWCHPDWRAD